jgi:hypothetical protein
MGASRNLRGVPAPRAPMGPSQQQFLRACPPPRHHNVIQSVSFKTIVFEKLHVIAKIPSLFKLGHVSHSAVLLNIQNRSYVSDATTVKWYLSLLKSYHFQRIR